MNIVTTRGQNNEGTLKNLVWDKELDNILLKEEILPKLWFVSTCLIGYLVGCLICKPEMAICLIDIGLIVTRILQQQM